MPPPIDDRVNEADSRGLASIAVDLLRNDVICGVLRPGERLRVQALSARYEIGATAIREALSRLVSEDLVVAEENRGFRVAPVSRSDLIDLTEARVDIESITLSRAMQRGDTAWEAELLATYHLLSRCPPPVSPETAVVFGRTHRLFHEKLLAGSQSGWLQAVCSLLYDKSERYRYLANVRTPADVTKRVDEHHAIVEAALRRDVAEACALLSEHYRRTADRIVNSPEARALFEVDRATRRSPARV